MENSTNTEFIEQYNNVYISIAALQQEVEVIHKNTKGYGYTYADLPAVFKVINPLMQKYNLGFIQKIEGKQMITIIFNTYDGSKVISKTDLPLECLEYQQVIKVKDGKEFTKYEIPGFEGMNKAQAIGSLITYFRRYTISTLLGLVTDVDTDGSAPKKDKASATTPATLSAPAASDLDPDGKPKTWLNKGDILDKVKSKIIAGEVTMDKIRSYYKLSSAVKHELDALFTEVEEFNEMNKDIKD